jgi:hypothetical protein
MPLPLKLPLVGRPPHFTCFHPFSLVCYRFPLNVLAQWPLNLPKDSNLLKNLLLPQEKRKAVASWKASLDSRPRLMICISLTSLDRVLIPAAILSFQG